MEFYESSTNFPFRKYIEMHTVLDVIGPLNGLAAVDFGCGSGLYTRILHGLGAYKVVGIDNSEGMISYATQRERKEQLGISYMLRDFSQPINENINDAFDLALAVYVLPYAATKEALVGKCTNIRRTLRPLNGRFVAVCLNPDFSTEPGWYQHYGFDMSVQEDRAEGAFVQLKSQSDGLEIVLDAYRWSRTTHEYALHSAGFEEVRWIIPRLSDEGLRLHGNAYWRNYLSCPQALILDARTKMGL